MKGFSRRMHPFAAVDYNFGWLNLSAVNANDIPTVNMEKMYENFKYFPLIYIVVETHVVVGGYNATGKANTQRKPSVELREVVFSHVGHNHKFALKGLFDFYSMNLLSSDLQMRKTMSAVGTRLGCNNIIVVIICPHTTEDSVICGFSWQSFYARGAEIQEENSPNGDAVNYQPLKPD